MLQRQLQRIRRWMVWGGLLLAGVLVIGSAPDRALSQAQCGFAEAFYYPIDTNSFQLVQDYAVANQRHRGFFHTGEDWFNGHGGTLGQPVRAVADGRVTYSYSLGWGRDGGVVIIEHTLPDGRIVYSQYGHLMETDNAPLPVRLSCVERGQVIGVIGDSRPAPHLHFEMRVNQSDVPGPGYTQEHPDTLGFRHPAQMIANLQMQLSPLYRWHFSSEGWRLVAPPVRLGDNGLVFISENFVRRLTPDGRVLWRAALDRPAVAVDRYQLSPLVYFADGQVNRLNVETGAVEETWTLPLEIAGAPFMLDGRPLFATRDGGLALLSDDRRAIVAQMDGVPAWERAHASERLLAFVTRRNLDDYELLIVRREADAIGEIVHRADLQALPGLTSAADGGLLVYTRGGLWHVDAAGVWSAALDDETPLPPGDPGAVALAADGRLFLTDGQQFHVYTRAAGGAGPQPDWQATLPQAVSGAMTLTLHGSAALITSQHGHVMTVRDSGGICGFTRVYGHDRALGWFDAGEDGVLRIAAGDVLFGLDWGRLTQGC